MPYLLHIMDRVYGVTLFKRTHKHLQFAMMDIVPLCIIVGGTYAEITNEETKEIVVMSTVYTGAR
ncbi:MAG TPA: hypothetical protein PL124_10480 [Candidatus Cloacimonadota bacterium]|nr:hypothetical protein [Candidatus Cloacimonadota bacterium]